MGVHGVLDEEQSRAQPFEVDLDVRADLSAAGRSDALPDTLDYGAIASAVESVITGERFALLERLAERITEVVLSDERVVEVTVVVRKLRPPVSVALDHAAVRITRSRR